MAVCFRRHLFKQMRPMDDAMLARHLENLDRRLANVEQILPTLASEESLRLAVAQLATKQELREECERLRSYMDVLSEAQRADILLLAEHLSASCPS
jgi:uncharacterized protein YicC (UPF0701 family)